MKYEIPKEKISMHLTGYDILYDTNQENDEKSKISFYVNGINSNIIINKKIYRKGKFL